MSATKDAITSTISSELRMLNQCTRPPGMRRYASQRLAHLVALSCLWCRRRVAVVCYVRFAPIFLFCVLPGGGFTQRN